MQKVSENVKKELKKAIYELGGIPPPLTIHEKVLAKKATAVLTEMGGSAKTKAFLQQLRDKGLSEEAPFLALKSGTISFRNKIWYAKGLHLQRRCIMDHIDLVVKFPDVVRSLQETGDYEKGVPASAIKKALDIEDMNSPAWAKLVSEALEAHQELRRDGKGAGTRYFCDSAKSLGGSGSKGSELRVKDFMVTAQIEPGIPLQDLATSVAIQFQTSMAVAERAIQEVIDRAEISLVDGRIYLTGQEPKSPEPKSETDVVNLTDERTGTNMQIRSDVDINVDDGVVTYGSSGELGQDIDLLEIRWEGGKATAKFGPYDFGATNGQPTITISKPED